MTFSTGPRSRPGKVTLPSDSSPGPMAESPLARAAASLANAPDAEGVAAALTALVPETFRGRAWVVAWDADAESAFWVPSTSAGPIPLEPRSQAASSLWLALREGRESLTP